MKLAPANLDALIHLCERARPDEIVQYEAMSGRPWDAEEVAFECHYREGEQFMLLADERPVCVAGWEPLRPGVFEGWMIGTMDDWRDHWRSITKHSRHIMEHMLGHDAHRLQIHCLKSRTWAAEWYARGLKMQHDGDLPGYGAHGETASLYARVRATEWA